MKRVIYLFVLATLVSGCTPMYYGSATSNYSPQFMDGIITDKSNLKIGMTKAELLAVEGEPWDKNKTVSSSGVREQWRYGDKTRTYVYFTNGILTSWSD